MDKDEKIIVHIEPEIADLIPGFLKNREENIKEIQASLEENDFHTIERLGHSMKGSGAGYGFDAITEIGKSLEEAAKGGDVEKITEELEKLSSYLEKVEVVNG